MLPDRPTEEDPVPEGMAIEVAHKLTEQEHTESAAHQRWHTVLEIAEVAMLAVVALLTAWSGYQAAKWDGEQSVKYGQASATRFEADAASTRGGQTLVSDSAMFNGWLAAHDAGKSELMSQYEKRFDPEYRVAFEAWLATDPFTNPKAPPGPGYMPQLKNVDVEHSKELNSEASHLFEEGTHARETGEKYVRDTVLFASVLFLIAMAQRAKKRGIRLSINIIAGCVLLFAAVSVATLPNL
jgi:hypothetical protein